MDLKALEQNLLSQIEAANDIASLDAVRVSAVGKKGSVTALFQTMGKLSHEERKDAGQRFNALKVVVTEALDQRQSTLENAALQEQLEKERVDVTLPVRPAPQGQAHPISAVIDEIVSIFADMGFVVAEGPDIEDDFHNFTALNIPEQHPARQMHDTFYLENGEVLRTHTSPVQIRTLLKEKPPIRMLAPGRTYRCDSDQTHTPMFHQVEGLVIEPGIHMGHLKGTLEEFLRRFFEVENVPVRFRPSYFPFTEPSAEVDIGCTRQKGKLKIGAGDDWLEVLGCGMVNTNVLKHCELDPAKHQGFAFGMGVERLAMLKYGMPDLRAFFGNDLRWLRHYGF